MASLPKGINIKMNKAFMESNQLKINFTLNIKWYAWISLIWNEAHKEYEIKWYQYPKLLKLILSHAFKMLTK